MADKLAQVRALLAKAESTTFPEEAEALLGKAEELIGKYFIDRALLGNHERHDVVGIQIIKIEGIYRPALMRLLAVIAESQGCKGFYTNGHTSIHFSICGFEDDRESAVLLYSALSIQAFRAGAAWMAGKHFDNVFKTKRSFLIGFAETVGQRLLEQRLRATAAAPGGAVGVALAIRDRQVDVDAYIERFNLRTSKSRLAANNGITAGRAAGLSAEIDPGVGGAQRKAIG